jgi:hypothetical protein
MATKAEIADTLNQLSAEFARRLDQLQAEGEITPSASVCLGGILEGMTSVEDAFRRCNDKPSER